MNRKAGIASGIVAAGMLAIAFFDGKKRMKPEPLTPVDGNSVSAVAAGEARRWIGLTEKSPTAEPFLREYWASTGQAYPGTDIAWSGAFVNWVIAHSDTPNSLLQTAAHIYYARKAYADRGISGRYGAFRPEEVTIEPGDIIVGARPGGLLTFEDIAHGTDFIPTHGDIVTERIGDTLRVVGGNVNDTVSDRLIPANSPHIIAVLKYQNEPHTTSA